MEALKVERDSLEKERDDLAICLWEQEKREEGIMMCKALLLSFFSVVDSSHMT